MAEALEESGYQVTRAENGQLGWQALQAAEGGLPDLILLDLLMPVMNGWQFCRAMKADPKVARVPLIAMSAAVSKDPKSPYFIDVDDFVAKPIELDDLLAKINGVLSGRRPSRAGLAPEGAV